MPAGPRDLSQALVKELDLTARAWDATLPAATDDPEWTMTVRPSSAWAGIDLAGLWRYRELLYFLAWRDLKVRYKQTALGVGWAVLRPLLTMLVFSVVFGHFAHIPSDGAPYPLFSYVGLLPWTFFASGIAQSANSLVGNAHLISKVYFPRLIIPAAASVGGLVDLAIGVVLLVGMMVFYHDRPTLALLALPVFVVLTLAAVVAIGIWLSALSVRYRDVAHAVPFLVQIWMYATPIAYPADIIHGKLHWVFALNPLAGVVEGFRWAVLPHSQFDAASLAISAGVTAVTLATGVFYFKRVERRFADVV